jgi:hypothetical protein
MKVVKSDAPMDRAKKARKDGNTVVPLVSTTSENALKYPIPVKKLMNHSYDKAYKTQPATPNVNKLGKRIILIWKFQIA